MPCSENVPNLDFQIQFPKTSLDELFLMLTFFDNSDFILQNYAQFLLIQHYVYQQNTTISLEHVQF